MKPPIIDTVKTLRLVHKALASVKDPEGADKDLYKTALSASSAVVPYLRQPQAPVQKQHYEAIQALHRAMGEPANDSED